MAEVTLKPQWTVILTTAELRLVLQALRRTLAPAEHDAASALCDMLSSQRAEVTKQTLGQANKLLENINA